jgi:hypothetical protein
MDGKELFQRLVLVLVGYLILSHVESINVALLGRLLRKGGKNEKYKIVEGWDFLQRIPLIATLARCLPGTG